MSKLLYTEWFFATVLSVFRGFGEYCYLFPYSEVYLLLVENSEYDLTNEIPSRCRLLEHSMSGIHW